MFADVGSRIMEHIVAMVLKAMDILYRLQSLLKYYLFVDAEDEMNLHES